MCPGVKITWPYGNTTPPTLTRRVPTCTISLSFSEFIGIYSSLGYRLLRSNPDSSPPSERSPTETGPPCSCTREALRSRCTTAQFRRSGHGGRASKRCDPRTSEGTQGTTGMDMFTSHFSIASIIFFGSSPGSISAPFMTLSLHRYQSSRYRPTSSTRSPRSFRSESCTPSEEPAADPRNHHNLRHNLHRSHHRNHHRSRRSFQNTTR